MTPIPIRMNEARACAIVNLARRWAHEPDELMTPSDAVGSFRPPGIFDAAGEMGKLMRLGVLMRVERGRYGRGPRWDEAVAAAMRLLGVKVIQPAAAHPKPLQMTTHRARVILNMLDSARPFAFTVYDARGPRRPTNDTASVMASMVAPGILIRESRGHYLRGPRWAEAVAAARHRLDEPGPVPEAKATGEAPGWTIEDAATGEPRGKGSPVIQQAVDGVASAAVRMVDVSEASNGTWHVISAPTGERLGVLIMRGSGDPAAHRRSFEFLMRQIGARTKRPPSTTEMFHPSGRCRCFGEGWCAWCRTLCDERCPDPRSLASCDHGFPHPDNPHARFAPYPRENVTMHTTRPPARRLLDLEYVHDNLPPYDIGLDRAGEWAMCREALDGNLPPARHPGARAAFTARALHLGW